MLCTRSKLKSLVNILSRYHKWEIEWYPETVITNTPRDASSLLNKLDKYMILEVSKKLNTSKEPKAIILEISIWNAISNLETMHSLLRSTGTKRALNMLMNNLLSLVMDHPKLHLQISVKNTKEML